MKDIAVYVMFVSGRRMVETGAWMQKRAVDWATENMRRSMMGDLPR